MIFLSKNKILISADDFGISRNASQKILELIRNGKINRVEVMVSKNITLEQIQELLNSGVKIDIHFHLKGDVLDQWQDRKKEFKEGNFKRILTFLWDYFFSKDRVGETEAEWYFQLSDFKKMFGRYPDGISSHEHIHFFPAYFRIIMEIASKNNIEFIRFGKNNYNNFNLVSLILNFLRFFNIKFYKKFKLNIKTTDFFVSFDWLKNYNKFIKSLPKDKEVELVFHPERPEEFNFLKNIS